MTADAERQFVDYEVRDGIATIALNRPEKLNAVSDEVVRQLMAVFRRFDADPEAHVAILCGRGRAGSAEAPSGSTRARPYAGQPRRRLAGPPLGTHPK